MTNTDKPIILVFVAYYLPGYKSGGPVRTIANMVAHLSDEFDFKIVTRDRDSFDDQPYPNIEVNDWNTVRGAEIFYCSPEFLSFGNIRSLISDTPHDVLYLNSFFRPRFTVEPLLARRLGLLSGRPVVLAPRGEFSKGAISLKAWKKRTFVKMARWVGLYDDVVWHASTEKEAEDIRREFSPGGESLDIRIAPNLPPPPRTGRGEKLSELPGRMEDRPLRIVFLSRISPKKNLDFALEVLSRVSIPVDFNIYGSVSNDNYWQQCHRLIRELPEYASADYHGAIPHQEVMDVLARHDLFLLPTRGENYGHVIYETLAAGTPALISDQTPWNYIEREGAGWVRPLDSPEKYVEVIERFADCGAETVSKHRANALQCAREVAEGEGPELNKQLFRDVLEGDRDR